MTFDAVRERTLPPPGTLRLIGALVPCDAMGVAVVDDDGTCAEEVVLPPSWTAMLLDGEVSGPVPLGIAHWGRHRDEADACGALEGVADCIAVAFSLGVDAVGQLWFDRTHEEFTDDDVARLELIGRASKPRGPAHCGSVLGLRILALPMLGLRSSGWRSRTR